MARGLEGCGIGEFLFSYLYLSTRFKRALRCPIITIMDLAPVITIAVGLAYWYSSYVYYFQNFTILLKF